MVEVKNEIAELQKKHIKELIMCCDDEELEYFITAIYEHPNWFKVQTSMIRKELNHE